MAIHLIYDPAFLKHNTGVHPENSLRLEAILRAIKEDETLSKKLIPVTPKPASEEDIERVHRPEMFQEIRKLCEEGAHFIDADTHISRDSFEVARLAAGAAIAGVDAAMKRMVTERSVWSGPPGHPRRLPMPWVSVSSTMPRSLRAMPRSSMVSSACSLSIGTCITAATAHRTSSGPIQPFLLFDAPVSYYPGTGAANRRGGREGEVSP
jgi:hypothetical protein